MVASTILALDSDEEMETLRTDATRAAGSSQRGINTAAASCAEELLRLHASAKSQNEREAVTSRLMRVGGPYHTLAAGLPFSVWLRSTQFHQGVVQATAALLEGYTARGVGSPRCGTGRTHADMLLTPPRLPGVIGSRAPMPRTSPCHSESDVTAPPIIDNCKSVLPIGCVLEDDDTKESRLSTGEALAISFLAMDEATTTLPHVSSYRAIQHSTGEYTSELVRSEDPSPSLGSGTSPFSIFDDDEGSAVLTPPSTGKRSAASCSLRKSAKRERHDSVHAADHTARRLFDPTASPSDATFSLSAAVMEEKRHKDLCRWMRTSQEVLSLSY